MINSFSINDKEIIKIFLEEYYLFNELRYPNIIFLLRGIFLI